MKGSWEDVIARARGLSGHLLSPARLRALAEAPDLAALAEALRQAGTLPDEGPLTPEAIGLGVRRAAAAALAVLARWSDRRSALLAVILEDEDRRALRGILRGAAQSVAPERRLAGVLPTPTLPERALGELARQPTVPAVATLLVAWRHPFGPALEAVAQSPHPELAAIESALARACIARVLETARRSRSKVLRDYALELLDLDNALSALALAGPDGRASVPKELFISGGTLSIDVFERAAAAPDRPAAADILARAMRRSPARDALRTHADDPAGLERALLGGQIAMLARRARLEPLSVAPILLFALRLRAQVLDLQRVIWGIALGAPPTVRIAGREAA